MQVTMQDTTAAAESYLTGTNIDRDTKGSPPAVLSMHPILLIGPVLITWS
jgi:hypothetical protein